mmetsp:Transcript_23031/g.87063  ORF Transcript_23031/g.87063 Transcript_23031/m.87063 type:complete len:275 (+) Transcript_23031:551-1375(+)
MRDAETGGETDLTASPSGAPAVAGAGTIHTGARSHKCAPLRRPPLATPASPCSDVATPRSTASRRPSPLSRSSAVAVVDEAAPERSNGSNGSRSSSWAASNPSPSYRTSTTSSPATAGPAPAGGGTASNVGGRPRSPTAATTLTATCTLGLADGSADADADTRPLDDTAPDPLGSCGRSFRASRLAPAAAAKEPRASMATAAWNTRAWSVRTSQPAAGASLLSPGESHPGLAEACSAVVPRAPSAVALAGRRPVLPSPGPTALAEAEVLSCLRP